MQDEIEDALMCARSYLGIESAASFTSVDELKSDEDIETQKLTLDEWDLWFCLSDDSDISNGD